jgi:hypothetical protein
VKYVASARMTARDSQKKAAVRMDRTWLAAWLPSSPFLSRGISLSLGLP